MRPPGGGSETTQLLVPKRWRSSHVDPSDFMSRLFGDYIICDELTDDVGRWSGLVWPIFGKLTARQFGSSATVRQRRPLTKIPVLTARFDRCTICLRWRGTARQKRARL